MLHRGTAPGWGGEGRTDLLDSGKFTPVDLSPYFTAAPPDFEPRGQAKKMGVASQDGLLHTPSGRQNFRGVPFLLGPEGAQKSWIVLSTRKDSWLTEAVEIPLNRKAGSICWAQFCNWDANETPPSERDAQEKVGQRMAELVCIYDDATQEVLPIRRRYEVNAPSVE